VLVNSTKALPPMMMSLYFATLVSRLVSRARSHASHHIFISSKGTTAQNRYGIGTSIKTLRRLHPPQQEAPTVDQVSDLVGDKTPKPHRSSAR
jgi:hypothetical protein